MSFLNKLVPKFLKNPAPQKEIVWNGSNIGEIRELVGERGRYFAAPNAWVMANEDVDVLDDPGFCAYAGDTIVLQGDKLFVKKNPVQ